MSTRAALTRLAAACALAALPMTGMAGDLVAAWRQAKQADPTMQAAGAARIAGRELAVQGDALLRPQMQFSASAMQLKQHASVPTQLSGILPADSSGRVYQAALQGTLPLINARARAEREQMHQRSALAEISYRSDQQDLLLRVGERYFGVLQAQETLAVVQAEKAAVQLQRDRAQARFDIGRGKATDLQEAQARLDGVGAREVSAQSTLSLRQAQYQALTGQPADALVPLSTHVPPRLPQPEALADWQQQAATGNLHVLRQQHELRIATAEIGKSTLASRPSLDLVTSYGYQSQNGGLSPLQAPDNARSAAIGLQFTLPLYTGGAIESRQREALARRTQAEQSLAAAQRDARLQAQDAYLAVSNGVARIAALGQSLASAQTALAATTLGRDVGTRTELDVLDAQQRVYSAQLDLVQARHEQQLARLRLSAAAGSLGEAELAALNGDLAG